MRASILISGICEYAQIPEISGNQQGEGNLRRKLVALCLDPASHRPFPTHRGCVSGSSHGVQQRLHSPTDTNKHVNGT